MFFLRSLTILLHLLTLTHCAVAQSQPCEIEGEYYIPYRDEEIETQQGYGSCCYKASIAESLTTLFIIVICVILYCMITQARLRLLTTTWCTKTHEEANNSLLGQDLILFIADLWCLSLCRKIINIHGQESEAQGQPLRWHVKCRKLWQHHAKRTISPWNLKVSTI